MHFKHVIFDMDGVLINSLPIMQKCWKSCQERFTIKFPFSSYQEHIGKPFQVIMQSIGVPSNISFDVEEHYHNEAIKYIDRILVYDGIVELMKELKKRNYILSILTSKSRQRTVSIVNRYFPKDIFNIIITPDDLPIGKGKPSPPEGLYVALKETKTNISETVFIGDMYVDLETARRAGCEFFHASWGGYGKIDDTCIQIKTIEELRSRLLGQ